MIGNNEGAWIFVSHSLKDWEKVRNIRNILEDKGHKPLLFFLKCLNDDSEIDDLIKREIEARNWFILCSSKNAKESKWVNAEIEYIKSLQEKVYEVIDLENDIEGQLDKIERLSKRITIFLSYSHSDRNIAQEIIRLLKNNDYRVLTPEVISSGINYQENIKIGIDESITKGFYILIINEDSLSRWAIDEIRYAFEKSNSSSKGGNIIPISLVEINKLRAMIPIDLEYLISNIQIFDFSKGALEANINKLITRLKSQEME